MWDQNGHFAAIGQTGPKNGIIAKDEAYGKAFRAMLEACQAYDAITCGVCAAFVPPRFVAKPFHAAMWAYETRTAKFYECSHDSR